MRRANNINVKKLISKKTDDLISRTTKFYFLQKKTKRKKIRNSEDAYNKIEK